MLSKITKKKKTKKIILNRSQTPFIRAQEVIPCHVRERYCRVLHDNHTASTVFVDEHCINSLSLSLSPLQLF